MNRLALPLSLLFAFAFVACDDDGNDDDSGDAGTGADDGDDGHTDEAHMDDGDDGADDVMETGSMETCMSSHECINDACTCTTPGKEDQACTDDTKCEDECEVCM